METYKNRGNLLFTETQENALRSRFENHPKSFPFSINGFSNEIAHIKRGAKEFFQDALLGEGNDRGGWYPAADMVIDGGANNPFQPFGSTYGEPRTLYNLHFAGLVAFIEQDSFKALQVYKELVYLSKLDELDFSDQVVFDRTLRSTINPVFMVFAKMSSNLNTLSLVNELVKNTSFYNTENEALDLWYKNCADWGQALIQNTQDYWYTAGGDWTSTSGLTMRTSPLQDYHTYYDSNGENGVNEISGIQESTINNRQWSIVSYIGNFGLSYGLTSYSNFHYSYFVRSIEIGIFADGTFLEHFRSDAYNGGAVPPIRNGIDYTFESLKSLVDGAHHHEVAVEKGFLPISERGKYYDFTTERGTDEIFVNFTGYSSTSTPGTPRGLKAAILNLSKYFKLAADGGFIGARYNTDGVTFNPVDQTFSSLPLKANTYYQDNEIGTFGMFDVAEGFLPPNVESKAFAVKPSNFGIGIGIGASEGGIVGYGKIENSFSSSDITANKIKETLEAVTVENDKLSASAITGLPDAPELNLNGQVLSLTGGNSVTLPEAVNISGVQYGSELIADAKFDSDGSEQTILTNTVIANGVATMTIASNVAGQILQTLGEPLKAGTEYLFTALIQTNVSGVRLLFQDNSSNTGGLSSANGLYTTDSTVEEVSISFTANENSNAIRVSKNIGTDFVLTIFEWSLKENLGEIQFGGSNTNFISTQTTNYTVLTSDSTVLADCTSGNLVFTLPPAASAFANGKGQIIHFKKIDVSSNTLTVEGDGSETIDGNLNEVLSVQYSPTLSIQTNGTEWFII